ENLIGTAAADTFNLLFDLDGTASGEDGDDIFNLGAGISTVVDGGADADRIVGANASSTFDATGPGAGNVAQGVGTVAFAGVERLSGGAASDVFNLTADIGGNVSGGAGADTFNVGATQSGGIDGGADSDTVTLSPGVTVAGVLTGGAG